MPFLKATNEILEVLTSTAAGLDVSVDYADMSATDLVPSSQETSISSATTTTVCNAPPASTQRQIKSIFVENKGTIANKITIQKDIAGTNYILYSCTLQAGENLTFIDGKGWEKHTKSGEVITTENVQKTSPIGAKSFTLMKVGAAMEAAGVMHFLGLSSGTPGAWAAGTPGLNGRATDGTTAADNGCLKIPNATTGINYLTAFLASFTAALTAFLLDILWVNTGLVVTTTTAQALTAVALPARDLNGTTDGADVLAGILVTTATTNAAAVTNTTCSYTNQDGVAGRTGTITSFPQTAAAGTLVPFQLQAGDTGVRSVQSVTLGTSYGAGAISLVLYRIIAGVPQYIANGGGMINNPNGFNIRLFNGVCALLAVLPTGTGATNATCFVNVEEK